MSIDKIHKLVGSGKNQIKINTDLLRIMDTEEAILYSYLVPVFQKSIKHESYKFFDDSRYILYSPAVIEKATGLSSFKQRNALNRLQKKDLLKVKLGQARTKYISINEDYSLLEKMLYGLSFTDLEKAFIQYLEFIGEQSSNKTSDLDFDKKYFLDCLKTEKLINDFQQINLGWLSKNNEIESEEAICV